MRERLGVSPHTMTITVIGRRRRRHHQHHASHSDIEVLVVWLADAPQRDLAKARQSLKTELYSRLPPPRGTKEARVVLLRK